MYLIVILTYYMHYILFVFSYPCSVWILQTEETIPLLRNKYLGRRLQYFIQFQELSPEWKIGTHELLSKFFLLYDIWQSVTISFFVRYFKQKDAKKKERDNEMSDAGDSDVSDNEFDKYLGEE